MTVKIYTSLIVMFVTCLIIEVCYFKQPKQKQFHKVGSISRATSHLLVILFCLVKIGD